MPISEMAPVPLIAGVVKQHRPPCVRRLTLPPAPAVEAHFFFDAVTLGSLRSVPMISLVIQRLEPPVRP